MPSQTLQSHAGYTASQAVIDFDQDRLTRKTAPVDICAHPAMLFGCDHDFVPWN
jgi:hypothetical protein